MRNLKPSTRNLKRERSEPLTEFVYFDLDDTLLDHRTAERSALADLHRHHAASLGRRTLEAVQAAYHEHNADLWGRYAAGEIGRDDLQRLRFERLLHALAVDGLEPAALGDDYLDRYARHWAPMPGALDAFHAVADRFPVGVLTNGFAEVQRAKLARFPDVRARLAALVISEDVGAMKPHPDVFAHAAEAACVPPATILYVGDSYRSDVRGGLDAGWQVAWFRGDPSRLGGEGDVFCFREWSALTERLGIGGGEEERRNG